MAPHGTGHTVTAQTSAECCLEFAHWTIDRLESGHPPSLRTWSAHCFYINDDHSPAPAFGFLKTGCRGVGTPRPESCFGRPLADTPAHAEARARPAVPDPRARALGRGVAGGIGGHGFTPAAG